MDFSSHIRAELAALIPVIYAIGAWLKNTDTIKDKYIPYILTGISVVLCTVYMLVDQGISMASALTGIVQGILITATAVYTNQLYKQSQSDS